MEFAERLSEGKRELTNKWIQRAMAVYPVDALAVFKRNKDQFANPLPHLISKGVEQLFEQLLEGADEEKVKPPLDSIIRLKAVQDLSPSLALSFIFDLKEILLDYFADDISDPDFLGNYLDISKDIDRIASVAFDIYVSCRESLYEIKTNEIRNQTHMLIRRVNEMDKQTKRGKN